MKQKIKSMLVAIALILAGSTVVAPALVSADLKGDACQGVNALNGSDSTDCPKAADAKISNLLSTVIQIFSVLVGFVAVVMVVVGGLKLITANGDSNAVASGRTTIMYALIGLVVVAVAQILVHYVIHKV